MAEGVYKIVEVCRCQREVAGEDAGVGTAVETAAGSIARSSGRRGDQDGHEGQNGKVAAFRTRVVALLQVRSLIRDAGPVLRGATRRMNGPQPAGTMAALRFRSAPLLRHRCGDALEGPAPVPPAVGPGRLAVHPRLAALDDVRRRQPRQAPQPQAGRLGLGMAELPWLDRLRRRRDVEEPPHVPEHDRVLDRDARDRRPRACRGRTPPHARGWPSGRRRRRSPGGSRGRDASRRCWRGRCTAGARSAGPSRRRRWSRTSPTTCGPGRSLGSRSHDTASWPRARKASRTTPENSQATRTRMSSRCGRLGRALRGVGSQLGVRPEPLGLQRGEAAAVAVERGPRPVQPASARRRRRRSRG